MTKASRGSKRWEAERAAWSVRYPWPVVVLAADPGEMAGASLVLPLAAVPKRRPGPALLSDASLTGCVGAGPAADTVCVWAREVRTYSRDVERCVEDAARFAHSCGLKLILAVEEWGRGGPLGIDSWIGLGEMRGAWKRAVILAADRYPDVIKISSCTVRVNMTTWRSHMLEETGDVGSTGRHIPFDSDGWKRAATRRCSQVYPALTIEGANAAEATLQGAYAIRSDELGRKLSPSLLKKSGMQAPPPRAKKAKTVPRKAEFEFLPMDEQDGDGIL